MFTLKKHEPFKFQFEDGKEVYELPPIQELSIDEIEQFNQLGDSKADTKTQLEFAKSFILKYNEGLKATDVEFIQILFAYRKSQRLMGES